VFVHVPFEAVSVLPWVALPLIVGGAVFTGGRDPASDAGVPGDVGELPDGDEDDGDEDDDGDEEDCFGFALAVLTQRQTRTYTIRPRRRTIRPCRRWTTRTWRRTSPALHFNG
jgi:hypothetical protein